MFEGGKGFRLSAIADSMFQDLQSSSRQRFPDTVKGWDVHSKNHGLGRYAWVAVRMNESASASGGRSAVSVSELVRSSRLSGAVRFLHILVRLLSASFPCFHLQFRCVYIESPSFGDFRRFRKKVRDF